MKHMHKVVFIIFCLFSIAGCDFQNSIFPRESTPTPSKNPIPTSTLTRTITSTHISTSTRTSTLNPVQIYTAVAQTVDAKYGTREPTPTFAPTITPEPNQRIFSMSETCRENVNKMITLHSGLHFPDHFLEDSIRQPGDFNVNSYLTAFKNLNVEKGYKFDYGYFGDNLGGKPFLYTVPTNVSPFKTFDDFLAYLEDQNSFNRSYMDLAHGYDYLDHIWVNGTYEGYFQILLLALQGDQFFLYWHGLYNDAIILCDSSDIQRAYEKLKFFEPNFSLEFPEDVKSKIPELDLQPRISVGENTVTIRIVQFSLWGGFWETYYTINRSPRHELLNVSGNTLIEYDCGVSF